MLPHRHRVLVTVVAGLASLSACGGDGGGADEPAPAEVMAEAKSQLDETSGVHVVLATEELPPGVSGIVSADGIGTHAPAFEGDLKVATSGLVADAAVIATDGKVYAKLPFTTKFVPIDPAEYGAPDPAALMEPEGGLSSLLTSAEDLERGDPERSGETVLTSYSGTVAGDVVAGIIPSADEGATFDATFTVDDDNRLAEAEITGPFYPDTGALTYTISFDQYDTSADITAP